MRKIILAATIVAASATAAFAESPNLENQSLRQQQQIEARQVANADAASFGFSNRDRTAPAQSYRDAAGNPVGSSREASEWRDLMFGN